MVSDFAVFLTIFTMVILDFLIGVPSPKLQVPSVFKVSGSRGALCLSVLRSQAALRGSVSKCKVCYGGESFR